MDDHSTDWLIDWLSSIMSYLLILQLKYPQNKPLDGESAPRNALILKKRSGVYQYNREITRRFDLTPGTYVIIPSTFRPHEEAEFMLRIYTEKIISSL